MAQIQPVSTWFQGETRQANVFSLYGNGNNLITEGNATFMYQLIELIIISPEEQTSQTLITGELNINGTDYEEYTNSLDSNAFIYQWAADKLNLILV
jgi:hypothetical protein